MEDRNLIEKIRQLKQVKGYTLYDLSKLTDMQISTLGRWLKTNHINKVYAQVIKERLGIK